MPSKNRARLIAASAVVATCVACTSVLGLKDLPLRDATGDADVAPEAAAEATVVDAPVAVDADAGPPNCPPDGAVTFCEKQCARPPLSAPIFCADFESDAGLAQWGLYNGFPNPIVFKDADIDVGPAPAYVGAPNNAAFARASASAGNLSGIMLLAGLDGGQPFRGLHIAAIMRFDDVEFYDAGATTNLRAISLFGFGHPGTAVGVSLGFVAGDDPDSVRGIILRESLVNFLAVNVGTISIDPAQQATKSELTTNWVPFELLVGPPAVLREAGAPCTPGASEDEAFTHAQVRLGQLSTGVACRRLPSDLERTDWYDTAAFQVGASISGYGRVAVFLDHVVVRGIE